MRRLILAGLVALLPAVALARAPMETNQLVDGNGNPIGTADNPLVTSGGGAASPTGSVTPAGTNGTQAQAVQGINGGVPVTMAPASATFSTLSCTLPGYSAGGSVVCTNEAGQQTTVACAANTACLIAADNSARKIAKWQTATPGASITIGYAATVAPGKGLAYDGPGTTGGQGGGSTDSNPTHRVSYYAASNTAGAVLVFVQGQ